MWIMLIVLIFIVVIAVVVWQIRRQAAAREAASAERMKAFMDEARAGATRAMPPGAAVAATKVPVAPVSAATPASAARMQPAPQLQPGTLAVHKPLANAEQLALYRLLKNTLPQHEIFPGMNLAAFIQPEDALTGFAREAQERRLADAMVDFLVCDAVLKPIVIVQCGVRSGKAAQSAAFAAACTAAIGVRWVTLSLQPLPAPEDIRQSILGA